MARNTCAKCGVDLPTADDVYCPECLAKPDEDPPAGEPDREKFYVIEPPPRRGAAGRVVDAGCSLWLLKIGVVLFLLLGFVAKEALHGNPVVGNVLFVIAALVVLVWTIRYFSWSRQIREEASKSEESQRNEFDQDATLPSE